MKKIHTLLVLFLFCVGVASGNQPAETDSPAYYKQMGDLMLDNLRYSEALNCYTDALRAAKEKKDDRMTVVCIGCISNVYGMIEDHHHSIYYEKMGYKKAEEIGDSVTQAMFAINLVGNYCALKQVKEAKAFYQKQLSLSLGDSAEDHFRALYNQANISLAEDNYDFAIFYYQKSYEYAHGRGMSKDILADIKMGIGKIILKQGKTDEAIKYFTESYDILQKNKLETLFPELYKYMSDAYTQKGDTVEAKKYFDKYLTISDSLFHSDKFKLANNKLFSYEMTDSQLTIDRLVNSNHIIIVALVVAILVIIVICGMYVVILRKNHEILAAQISLVSRQKEIIRNEKIMKEYISNIPTEQKRELTSRITKVMEDVATISRSDFNLAMLAQMVSSNTNYVSCTINETFGKNFSGLLNQYRINEACKRLTDEEHYGNFTIQSIAQDLGYGSQSGFIKVFSKIVGMTPSNYQKLARQKSSNAEDDGNV